MITRKEAEAHERDAQADVRLAAAQKKMYAALSNVVKGKAKQSGGAGVPPVLSGKSAKDRQSSSGK
jgi:hypothetical protein